MLSIIQSSLHTSATNSSHTGPCHLKTLLNLVYTHCKKRRVRSTPGGRSQGRQHRGTWYAHENFDARPGNQTGLDPEFFVRIWRISSKLRTSGPEPQTVGSIVHDFLNGPSLQLVYCWSHLVLITDRFFCWPNFPLIGLPLGLHSELVSRSCQLRNIVAPPKLSLFCNTS